MNLETSRKVLKIFGIIGIVLAVLSLIVSILSLVGGGVVAGMPETANDSELALGTVELMLAGIIGIISSVINLIEGIVSVKASKNNKFGTAAFVFAILGLIGSCVNGITSISKGGLDGASIVGVLLGIVLSVVILLSANRVRVAYKNGEE